MAFQNVVSPLGIYITVLVNCFIGVGFNNIYSDSLWFYSPQLCEIRFTNKHGETKNLFRVCCRYLRFRYILKQAALFSTMPAWTFGEAGGAWLPPTLFFFETPDDKFTWDIGRQAYAHKI